MNIRLVKVHYMPKELETGILYVSKKYYTAAHLCPCGCGSKIRTPLGPNGWELKKTTSGPTLMPSIGNWQLPCQSHYWIKNGEIIWANKWTNEEIISSRKKEEERRHLYYEKLNPRHKILKKFWIWLISLFKKLN